MNEKKFKIIICGLKGSGKTSLCKRPFMNFFNHKLRETIGVDFFSGKITFGHLNIKLHIWDFGGDKS